jgi:hypothetical protein
MTVTLNSAGGASVPNWLIVQTNSALSGLSTITFSGLSGYAKYRLMASNLVAVSGTTVVTLNSDTTAKYSFVSTANVNSVISDGYQTYKGVAQTSVPLSINPSENGVNPSFDVTVDNALILTPKAIVGWGADTTNLGTIAGAMGRIDGIYQSSSLLTSITITRTANFTSGTIFLLGAS